MEIRYLKSPHVFELGGGFKYMFFYVHLSTSIWENDAFLTHLKPPTSEEFTSNVHHFLISKNFPICRVFLPMFPKMCILKTQTRLKHGILEIVTMLQILHKTAFLGNCSYCSPSLIFFRYTPVKTNKSPENWCLEDEMSLKTVPF